MLSLSQALEIDTPFYELVQLLSPSHFSLDSIPQDHWPYIVSFANRMRVIPLLFFMLKQNQKIQPPPEILEELRSMYHMNSGRNLTISRELGRMLTSFDENAIRVMPLKGAYLAYAVYERPSVRQMLDLDLMVRWEDMAKAIATLQSLGYHATEKFSVSDECRRFDHHGPGYYIHSSGVKVELHWNVIDAHSIGEREIALGEIFLSRARPGMLVGAKTYLMTHEDLIFHSAIHQTVHHTFNLGIREFYDIEQIYNKFRGHIDWERLFVLARDLTLERPLLLTLALTDLITGSDILETVKQKGFSSEIPDCYLIEAIGEIQRKDTRHSVSFKISNSKPGILKLIRPTLNRIFLSRESMALKYHLPSDSLMIYLFYPYRLYDLIIHYGPDLCGEYFSSSQEKRNRDFWKWMYGE
ncbi:MAG: nucleotidyltransferase family protein [Methanobacteriota archaeon]